MKKRKIIIFFALSLLLSLLVCAENPKIRIGLKFGSSSVNQDLSVSYDNGFQVGYTADDNSFLPVMFYPDTTAVINAVDDTIRILSSDDGSVIFEGYAGQPVSICPLSSELDGEDYIPFAWIGSIKYPETLMFSASGGNITVINIVDSEQYFKGVLPSEVFPSWHPEALKAAAITTRTYTYHSMNGKHANYGFDVCSTTCCQVYSGITKCKESTNKAVEETNNLVLTYNGDLITAVYHAISGGITETAAGAWGSSPENYPYLTVVETPFEMYYDIANGKWTKILYDEDFDTLIQDYYGSARIATPIKSISLDDATPGYLNNMTITGANGKSIFLKTSSNIRSFFSVLSSNFTIGHVYMPSESKFDSASVLSADGEYTLNAGEEASIISADGEEYISGIRSAHFIDGKGYGHGVGLSQYGAQFAAKEGYTYNEILDIYFPGTIIEDYTLMSDNQPTEDLVYEN